MNCFSIVWLDRFSRLQVRLSILPPILQPCFKLGRPCTAASPQNNEPSCNKSEMESSVWPGVSMILPRSMHAASLRVSSVIRTHLPVKAWFNGGKRCAHLQILSFVYRKQGRTGSTSSLEFCPLNKTAKALSLIITFIVAVSHNISFKYPAWSSWAWGRKI